MNPQGYGQFLVDLAWRFGPNVQIQAVLAKGSLLAIAPLGIVATGVLYGLLAGATKSVAHLYTLPGHNGLRSLPAVLLDRRCSIRNATIYKNFGVIIGQDALHLATFDC